MSVATPPKKRAPMLSSRVRVFWWLCLLLVAWWVFGTIQFVFFPSAHRLAVLAHLEKLSPQLAMETRRGEVLGMVFGTTFWSALTLGFAWLSAFGRFRFARWGIVFVFVVRDAILPIVVSVLYPVPVSHLADVNQIGWEALRSYTSPALEIIAVAFLFSVTNAPRQSA